MGSRLRPLRELGDSAGAVELVSDGGPLPANHRFILVIGNSTVAAFATGERMEVAPHPADAPRLVVHDVKAPSVYVLSSYPAVPRKDAEVIFRCWDEVDGRALVVSLAKNDERGSKADRRCLARSLAAGLGPPGRVAFEVPAS